MVSWTALVVGLAAAAVLSAVVYLDAKRVGIDRPRRWAAIAFFPTAAGVATYAFVPTIPVPGLLVLLLVGPTIYVLERDDSMHEDVADPTTLPDRSAENRADAGEPFVGEGESLADADESSGGE